MTVHHEHESQNDFSLLTADGLLSGLEMAAAKQFAAHILDAPISTITVVREFTNRLRTEGITEILVGGEALANMAKLAGIDLEHLQDVSPEAANKIHAALADACLGSGGQLATSKNPAKLCGLYAMEPDPRDRVNRVKTRPAAPYRAARFARIGAKVLVKALYDEHDMERRDKFMELSAHIDELDKQDEDEKRVLDAEQEAEARKKRTERKLSVEAQAEIAGKAKAAAERGEKIVRVPETMAELKPALEGAREGKKAIVADPAELEAARERSEREAARRESNKKRIDVLENGMSKIVETLQGLAGLFKQG